MKKTLADLAKQFENVEPSKKSSYPKAEEDWLIKRMDLFKKMDPELALLANKIAQKKHSQLPNSNLGINADLKNLNVNVRGANPPLEEVVKVPGGEGGLIEDISRVTGKVPVDPNSIVKGSASTPQNVSGVVKGVTERIDTTPARVISGDEFLAKKAALLTKLGKTGAKAFSALAGPAVGIGTALATGDASAAMPEALQSEEAGRGSDTQNMPEMNKPAEGGYMSPERLKRLQEQWRNR